MVFKLIVNEDDECDCQVVRALAPGRNSKITVENNILRVDVLRSPVPPIPPSGGGLITVTLRLSNRSVLQDNIYNKHEPDHYNPGGLDRIDRATVLT